MAPRDGVLVGDRRWGRGAVIVGGAILPFSGVLVPEVGRGRERPAFATIAAMRRAVRELTALDADLVLLTAPRAATPTGAQPAVRSARSLHARFDEFGERETEIVAEGAPAIAEAALQAGLAAADPSAALGAEAATILYFARPLLARGPVLSIETPPAESAEARAALVSLGTRLATLPPLAARRVVVLTGAELSQRIFPGAPGGYHPDGARFDAAVQHALAAANLAMLEREAAALAPQAGERALGGLSLLRGLLGQAGAAFRVLSYAAPFGAGYLVATFATGAAY
jgi:hypothetical protein